MCDGTEPLEFTYTTWLWHDYYLSHIFSKEFIFIWKKFKVHNADDKISINLLVLLIIYGQLKH